jgi:3-deoxy-D-manno-octulosonic-acid transferase
LFVGAKAESYSSRSLESYKSLTQSRQTTAKVSTNWLATNKNKNIVASRILSLGSKTLEGTHNLKAI